MKNVTVAQKIAASLRPYDVTQYNHDRKQWCDSIVLARNEAEAINAVHPIGEFYEGTCKIADWRMLQCLQEKQAKDQTCPRDEWVFSWYPCTYEQATSIRTQCFLRQAAFWYRVKLQANQRHHRIRSIW